MITRSGKEALLLLAIRQGFITPCFSEEIRAEYSGGAGAAQFWILSG